MISTIYFIILLAFQFWYLTSGKLKHAQSTGYILHIVRSSREYRLAGGALFMLATALFVMKLGWMSGISASLVGLMGIGSLVVVLAPLRYLQWQGVLLLYIFFFILEFFI
jgi:hypothetical protein